MATTRTAPQTTDELYEALRENDDRPYGRARTIAAEELAEAAEQFGDPVALVDALLELQEAYTYSSEPRKSPVVFARLLQMFDEQPDVFDERLRNQMYWRFKWVSGALRAMPEVPLATLEQWLAEMRGRYEKAGLGLQPYYGQAYHLAAHVGGDPAETAAAYELWAGRARSMFSDCEACETNGRARFHLRAGDDERALRMWEPVLSGRQTCQEEPAHSISQALLPLLRTGRTERARELHLAGYRSCRRKASMAHDVGRHLEFCALTGNEARGLELLAENRTLFAEVEAPDDLLDFLTGVEVLLRRVEALGRGGLPTAGFPGRTWTVAGLRAEVAARADDLAARFDARNGTTAHADARRERLEREPLLDALELTLRTRSLDEVDPAGGAPAAAVPVGRPPAVLPESLPELILRARELDEPGNPDARAHWTRLAALVEAPDYAHPEDPAVGPLARLRADLADHAAGLAFEKEDYGTAAARYEESAALYDEAGLPAHAAVERACALLTAAERHTSRADGGRSGDGDGDGNGDGGGDGAEDGSEAKAAALAAAHAGLVKLQEETAGLAPYQEARILRMRATALGMLLETAGEDAQEERRDAVLAEVDLLEAFAARHGIHGQVSRAGLVRASTYAITGGLPEAAAEVDRVLDGLRENGPEWHLPHAYGLRGKIRFGMRDAEGACAGFGEALREAAKWPVYGAYSARLHGDLAHTCMALGRREEATRHLTRSAELELRHGSRTEAFATYGHAAQFSLDGGRVEDCIALLDSVLAEPDVAAGELDDRLVAQLRLTRARALREGGDGRAATEEFLALAAESAGWEDDPGSHAMIAGETAVLLAESGAFDRAREAVDQALAAYAREPRYEQISNCLREVARIQANQEGADGLARALTFLDDAARVAEEARAAGFTASGRSLDSALAYEHGRVNAYAGEFEDSLAALERALALLGEPGPDADADHAGEWAECVRLAGIVEGAYLERRDPALERIDAAVGLLRAAGHEDATSDLTSLAGRLRSE
jgi:hypothetical protein